MAYIDKGKIPYYLDTSEEAPMEGRKIAFKSDIDKIPPADVVEVKHGKWVEVAENSTGKIIACTNCKKHINPNKKDVAMNRASERPSYCSNCGAKMDGRK